MPEKIYITYPTPDDDSSLNQETIDAFIDHTKKMMSQYRQEEIDFFIKGNEFDDKSFDKYVTRNNIYVVLQFEGSKANDLFAREIEQIAGAVNVNENKVSKGVTGIFRACLTPSNLNLPQLIANIQPYNFYELNRYSRKFKSYVNDEEGLPEAYWAKLLDMVVDISAYINERNLTSSEKDKAERYIFMGQTSPDQSVSRDEIIRELKHFGFKILPSVEFPEDFEGIEKTVTDSLVHCKYAIQMFGLQYGNILKNTKYSLIDFQNRIISDYQKKNVKQDLKRFIWIPNDLKTTDQRQNLYLRRIKRDEAGENTEIIEAPIEVFKTAVIQEIQMKDERDKQREKQRKIYLIFEEKEKENASKWIDKLKSLSIQPIFLDYTKQIGIYARHLQNLSDADAIIIYLGKSDEEWLRSKIRDLVKVPGYIENKKFKALGVILNSSTKNTMADYFDERIDVIREDLAGNKGLDEFISKLD